jgi:hypothetical protein
MRRYPVSFVVRASSASSAPFPAGQPGRFGALLHPLLDDPMAGLAFNGRRSR